MWTILTKEVSTFLNSLIAYIIIVLFLVTMGLFVWVLPDTSILEYGFAEMDTLFSVAPFIFMFLIPAITMRSFAEERKTGTIELLSSKPLTDLQIIIGKYLATFFLVCLAILPTAIYYYSIVELGNPEGNIDTPGVLGSYLGLLLLAAVFNAIGIFTSSFNENQITSFVYAVTLCYLFHSGFGALSGINVWGAWSDYVAALGIDYHYHTISKGLIDSRDLLYFFSVIAALIASTHLVLSARKW